MNQARISVSTKNPVLKLLYIGLGLLLVNTWIYITMVLPQHTTTRWQTKSNMDTQIHVKTNQHE
ncbi:MAG: hypothetical protein LBR15_07830 [Methanobrevibacter sp.]|nr:hypothetical protein [Candidatus Methanovirga australis]